MGDSLYVNVGCYAKYYYTITSLIVLKSCGGLVIALRSRAKSRAKSRAIALDLALDRRSNYSGNNPVIISRANRARYYYWIITRAATRFAYNYLT